MGQFLDTMCYQPQQAKGELPCEFAVTGNVEGIKSVCRMEGCASLEWTDGEGKTPLIAACTSPRGFEVAKTLINLGANVNAYSPGPRGGTPLHHAAKEGLEETIELLLSHGATASVRNYDGQTPLDVAEMQGFTNLVHLLESEEEVEFAMALSSSLESAIVCESTQNSVSANVLETDSDDAAFAMAMSASFQSDIGTQNSSPAETTVEDVELAMAIRDSMISDGTQSRISVPATAGEDEELAIALTSSIESAEDVELRDALYASIQSSLEERRAMHIFSTAGNRVAKTPSAPPMPESCIICCDAPIEGVCIPCGHMAACMYCLAKIEAEKRECPVCRGKIEKVIKVFIG